MIEGLQPYAEYKESGLPWLGRCPDHWKLRRAKILFQERVQKGFPNEPLLAATQTKGVVRKEDYETRTVTAQKDLHLLKLVEVGDYVISLRSFQGGIEVAHYRGIISPAYTVLKPRGEAKSGYYSKFFKSRQFIDSLSLFVTGIREGHNIDYERMSRAEMPCPPPDEQAVIVRFLDHANRKIDGFIQAKRKLITLLGEQKQAIIHRAVTGKDEVRRMKDESGTSSFILQPSSLPKKPSGIPWLGDIPKHWDTPLLGRCLIKIEQGWSPVAAEGELADQQWCVLTLSSVRRGVFNPAAIKPVKSSDAIPRDIQVVDGDFLLTRSNTRERVGDVCIAEGVRPRTLLCDLIYRLSLRKTAFAPRFLMYQLLCQVGRSQIEKDARGSSGTMPKISQSHIKSWRVLLPPIAEQQDIINTIERESEPLNTAIASTEREIALMQEYRTRLAADVVTGKLDVRPAAALLPDLSATPEPVGDEAPEEREPEENEA